MVRSSLWGLRTLMKRRRGADADGGLVDDRVRLAIGGTAVVAASAALVIAVAATNATALADQTGVAAGSLGVRVPAATSTPTPTPVESAVIPAEPAPEAPVVAPETITVPAPEPVVVVPASPAEIPGSVEDSVLDEVRATGRWDSAWAAAARYGWSDDRVQAWIDALKDRIAQRSWQGSHWNDGGRDDSSWSDRAYSGTTERGEQKTSEKSDQDQSHGSPDRRD